MCTVSCIPTLRSLRSFAGVVILLLGGIVESINAAVIHVEAGCLESGVSVCWSSWLYG